MKVTRCLAPFVVAAALMGFSNAHALVLNVDMDGVVPYCNGQIQPVAMGNGFQISAPTDIVDVCPANVLFLDIFSGNFLAAPNPSTFRLESVSGSTFTLNSFVVDMLLPVTPQPVMLTSSSGGNTTFTTDGTVTTMETLTFSDFNDVTYIDFTVTGAIGFDNFNVTTAAPVSEPGKLGALGLGVLLLAGIKAHRRRNG